MPDKELDLNHWVHPRTGEHRFYIRNWEEVIGLSKEYYGTGNICFASFRGEALSNSEAHRICMKLWFDTNKKLHVDDFNGGRCSLRVPDVHRYVEEYIKECGGLTLPEPFNNDPRKELTK